MTSTDFAARYRLLKNVATRGARSFLAQQVALGRMVMVHYLDSETPEQRSATLARLDALKPSAREKLLEVVDVDGAPVAVTLFISSFADFTTWLDQVSVPAPKPESPKAAANMPGEFTRAFSKVETPAPPPVPAAKTEPPPQRQSPPMAAPPAPQPVPRQAGEFTRIFGKVDAGEPTTPPATRAERATNAPPPVADEIDSPTLIMEAPKAASRPAAKPAAPPAAPPPPRPAAPSSAEGAAGFTAIFGRVGETHLPDDLPAETPEPAAAAPGVGHVMQPPPVPDFHQSAGPLPPAPSVPPSPSGGGEFTQFFQRLSATAGPPPSTPAGAAPPPTPPPSFAPPSEPPRSIDQPRPELIPPSMPAAVPPVVLPPPSLGGAALPPPSLGSSLPAPALGLTPMLVPPSAPRPLEAKGPPNAAPSVPSAPLTPASPWGAPPAGSAGMFGASAAPSEYTRILGKVTVPPPPPIAIQPPAAANPAAAGQKSSKSMLPLIVALSVVILLTIAMVAYFVAKK